MNLPNLVGVHEAGIAHHVAAVGQIHSEYRPAPVPYRTRAVLVEILIVVLSLHSFVGSGKRSAESLLVDGRPLTAYGGLRAQPGWLRGKVHEEGTISSRGRSSLAGREFLGCRARTRRFLRFRRVALA